MFVLFCFIKKIKNDMARGDHVGLLQQSRCRCSSPFREFSMLENSRALRGPKCHLMIPIKRNILASHKRFIFTLKFHLNKTRFKYSLFSVKLHMRVESPCYNNMSKFHFKFQFLNLKER